MNMRQSLNGPLVTSIAAVSLLAIMLLATVPSLLAAAFGGGVRGQDPSDRIASHVQKHDELMTTYMERFNGRSVFFRPPAPVVAAPPPPPPKEEPKREEPPPVRPTGPAPPPDKYQGPPVSIVLGDKVLFKGATARDSGLWISVGEEVNGLKVLETNAPKSVRVAYQRGEYDVPVFDWDMSFFRDPSEARKPMEGLIVIGTGQPSPPPQPQPQPRNTTGRERAVPVQPAPEAPEAFDPPMDDEEAMRRAAEEQGIEPGDLDEVDFHPAGEPDEPEFDPDFDPDADPDAEGEVDPEEEIDLEEEPSEDPDNPDDPDDPENKQQKDDPAGSQQAGSQQPQQKKPNK